MSSVVSAARKMPRTRRDGRARSGGCAPSVTAAPVLRLRMAVRAEQHQILNPVVERVAVAVVQLQRERLSTPLAQAALFAGVRQKPCLAKTLLQVPSIAADAQREDRFVRRGARPRYEIAPPASVV